MTRPYSLANSWSNPSWWRYWRTDVSTMTSGTLRVVGYLVCAQTERVYVELSQPR
jgi:hypothetical protein